MNDVNCSDLVVKGISVISSCTTTKQLVIALKYATRAIDRAFPPADFCCSGARQWSISFAASEFQVKRRELEAQTCP